jgi:transposase
MARALSLDLRERVVEAVADGMSCRQAAVRFGVSASSAIRWAAQVRLGLALAPMKQGGRSQHIEAEAAFILGAIAERPDLTLAELRARLKERGKNAGIGTLWRFFQRHGITLKKDCPRRRAEPRGCKGGSRSLVRRAARP